MRFSLEKREISYSPTIMQILHLVGGHDKKMRRYISVIFKVPHPQQPFKVLPIKEGTKTPPHTSQIKKGEGLKITLKIASLHYKTQHEGSVRSVQDWEFGLFAPHPLY